MSLTWQRQQFLDRDFETLAAKERIQDQHRRELTRREMDLRDREQACELLESHLAWRLHTLVSNSLLLEKAADGELQRTT